MLEPMAETASEAFKLLQNLKTGNDLGGDLDHSFIFRDEQMDTKEVKKTIQPSNTRGKITTQVFLTPSL